MSETSPQNQGTAPVAANAHRRWEWFWRIISGLMVITIGWVAWVMYQVMPRSVVTPLVYESQLGRIRTPASGTSEGAATPQAAAPVAQPSPRAAAADLAMDQAQAAMRAGAHQAAADVQAAALTRAEELERGGGLKLATEITTPLAETRSSSKKNAQGHTGTAPPAAADAAGKAR
ncbi:MAG: hypothetical protein ABIH03_04280 [Pseudomonadota bacterium]